MKGRGRNGDEEGRRGRRRREEVSWYCREWLCELLLFLVCFYSGKPLSQTDNELISILCQALDRARRICPRQANFHRISASERK